MLEPPFLDFIHPEDVQSTIEVIEQELKKGKKVLSFENRYRTRKSGYRWLEWTSHPLVEQGITYAIAHDITERKAAEKELRNSHGSAKKSLEIARTCTTAMVQLFDMLSLNWFPGEIPVNDYLPVLVDRIVDDYPAELNVIKRLSDVKTPPGMAFSLGIIVHELVTNALLHAFPEGKEKSLELTVTQTGTRITVIVQDNGKGFDCQKTPNGFGLELVYKLVDQLQGQLVMERDNGTKYYLIFEL